MAIPTDVTQYTSAGASGHNDTVAIGTFKQCESQDGDPETVLFIHCGFVPKIIFWTNETHGVAQAAHSVMWFDPMHGTMSWVGCMTIGAGDYLNDVDGFRGWNSAVVRTPQDGGPTGMDGYGVVPADYYYLKEGVAAQSGGFVQDKVIGFKVVSAIYDVGHAHHRQILGTNEDILHYVALG